MKELLNKTLMITLVVLFVQAILLSLLVFVNIILGLVNKGAKLPGIEKIQKSMKDICEFMSVTSGLLGILASVLGLANRFVNPDLYLDDEDGVEKEGILDSEEIKNMLNKKAA